MDKGNNIKPLSTVEQKPSFSLKVDSLGFACIILNENGNEIRATLSNDQCRKIARNLRGIADSNGNNNKTP